MLAQFHNGGVADKGGVDSGGSRPSGDGGKRDSTGEQAQHAAKKGFPGYSGMHSPYPWGSALSFGAVAYGVVNFVLLPYWFYSVSWLRWAWAAGVVVYLATMKLRTGMDTLLV